MCFSFLLLVGSFVAVPTYKKSFRYISMPVPVHALKEATPERDCKYVIRQNTYINALVRNTKKALNWISDAITDKRCGAAPPPTTGRQHESSVTSLQTVAVDAIRIDVIWNEQNECITYMYTYWRQEETVAAATAQASTLLPENSNYKVYPQPIHYSMAIIDLICFGNRFFFICFGPNTMRHKQNRRMDLVNYYELFVWCPFISLSSCLTISPA